MTARELRKALKNMPADAEVIGICGWDGGPVSTVKLNPTTGYVVVRVKPS